MQGPEYWMERADEYKELANRTSDEAEKEAYLRLAQSCAELAVRQAELNDRAWLRRNDN